MIKAEIFSQLFSNCWPTQEQLVTFADNRHGYGADNGYYGVKYPSDLDEYQREVEGEFIPDGYVEINFWDGNHCKIQTLESEYLSEVEKYLINSGSENLADKLRNSQQGTLVEHELPC